MPTHDETDDRDDRLDEPEPESEIIHDLDAFLAEQMDEAAARRESAERSRAVREDLAVGPDAGTVPEPAKAKRRKGAARG